MDQQHFRLRDLALNDSGFAFDPLTGHTFTINATGRFALRCLKDGMTSDETAHRLRESFAVSGEHDPSRDVQDFVSQLRECGLLK
jgi:hypothetical protein